MHAANAAGGENLEPREFGDIHGRCDGGAGRAAARRQGAEIAPRRLDDAAGQPRQRFKLIALKAYAKPTLDHGDGGWRRAALDNRRLQRQRGL